MRYRDYWGDDVVEVGRIADLSREGKAIAAIWYDKYDCLRYKYQIRSVIDEFLISGVADTSLKRLVFVKNPNGAVARDKIPLPHDAT